MTDPDIGGTDLTILEAGTVGCDHYADVELTGDPTLTGYTEQDEAFLDAIEADRKPSTNTVEQALVVQRVMDAIYRSSETGLSQPVENPDPELAELAATPRAD